MFFFEYCEISKTTYCKEHLRAVASGDTQGIIKTYEVFTIMKTEVLWTDMYNASWGSMNSYIQAYI